MADSKTSQAVPDNPIIWCLYGARTGDNHQVSALAGALSESLGGNLVEKHLDYSPAYGIPNVLLGATLCTVRKPSRAQLAPSWPDIVIAAGRRSVAPARWIKEQSGHKSKLIQIGRPRAPLDLFDLVITTAQYGLPPGDNVLCLSLPLQPPVTAGAENNPELAPDSLFGDLPRPWTGILVGGTSWPFILDTEAAAGLADDLNRWARQFGGSVLVSTSPRTAAESAAELENALEAPHYFHRWGPGIDNPYKAILQSADQLVVTGDSVSMLADACRSGKPTAIWSLRLRRDPVSRFCLALGKQAHSKTPIGICLRFAALKGLFTPPRHVGRLMSEIVTSKRASLFDPARAIGTPPAIASADDMDLAVARIRALFDG